MTRSTASRRRPAHIPPFKPNEIRTAMQFAAAMKTIDDSPVSIDDDKPGEDAEAPKRRLARNVVGPRLRAARETAGLQQADAARRLGYSTSGQLSQHEQGKRLMPIPELIRAANLYGVSIDHLLGATSEVHRDPMLSLRAATVRGLRGMLDGLAVGLVDAIGAHAAVAGPDVVTARAIVSAGQALIDALGVLMRQPEFDETKGSASVARLSSEFEVRLHEVRNAIQKFDRMDRDLRERIASATAANDE